MATAISAALDAVTSVWTGFFMANPFMLVLVGVAGIAVAGGVIMGFIRSR